MTPSIHPQHAQASAHALLSPPRQLNLHPACARLAAPRRPAAAVPVLQALKQAWPSLEDDEDALHALALLGRSHRVRPGGLLLKDGVSNAAGSLWLLVRGKLSMGLHDPKAVWRQGRALQPGQWIDLASAWPQAPFPETALALTPVLAHEFPAQAVLALCAAHPLLLKVLLASLGSSACEAMASRQAMSTQDFPTRLAEWLLNELRLNGQGDCLNLGLLKRDLAAQLGVTPETLSRTLRLFQQQGLIVMKHRELRILAPAGLAALR
ncbi:Crp/Fnr family transcriptional regulator [Roseateles albus]|uniref:Crp/Fnr family transcriptional regulator n=1 Tax=Roseateles albus TaxID=2987525 RepID=A0ABT5KBK3_9BURK|nr:Crp/Fnr family transcriptional regulator [Roseateles albus]MDC8771263.1 Crp/Fnr family transcriptional regulator [Roseateles albus]